MKFVVDFKGGKIKTTSKKIKSFLKARRKQKWKNKLQKHSTAF